MARKYYPNKILAEIAYGNADECEAVKKYYELLEVIQNNYDMLDEEEKKVTNMYIKQITDRIIPEEQAHIEILSSFAQELSGIPAEK